MVTFYLLVFIREKRRCKRHKTYNVGLNALLYLFCFKIKNRFVAFIRKSNAIIINIFIFNKRLKFLNQILLKTNYCAPRM